jgi:hypothetical protein
MTPSRDDIVTTSTCACGARFIPVRRQRYCSPACRQAAYRRRQPAAPTTLEETSPALTGPRRDHTVYVCGECEQRDLGLQWCPECNRPCTRIGYGGPCPKLRGASRG